MLMHGSHSGLSQVFVYHLRGLEAQAAVHWAVLPTDAETPHEQCVGTRCSVHVMNCMLLEGKDRLVGMCSARAESVAC